MRLSSHYHIPLAPDRLRRYRLIIRPDDATGLPDDDRQALDAIADRVAVVTSRQAATAFLRELGPVAVWVPEGVFALLRRGQVDGKTVLACHLLNRNQLAPG